jgi:hypoxanthine phosphoribosyltransferase
MKIFNSNIQIFNLKYLFKVEVYIVIKMSRIFQESLNISNKIQKHYNNEIISSVKDLVQIEDIPIPKEYANNISKILFTEKQILKRIGELAIEISNDYHGKEIIICCLLKGAFFLVSDLVRRLTVKNQIDFMIVSSYDNRTKSSGSVKLEKDLSINPSGRHIIIVEDLIDTGTTLKWIKQHLLCKDVASLKICCLLDKKARRETKVQIDYCGFDCPDEFVIGYGMDFAEDYRSLPFVGVLKPEVYY